MLRKGIRLCSILLACIMTMTTLCIPVGATEDSMLNVETVVAEAEAQTETTEAQEDAKEQETAETAEGNVDTDASVSAVNKEQITKILPLTDPLMQKVLHHYWAEESLQAFLLDASFEGKDTRETVHIEAKQPKDGQKLYLYRLIETDEEREKLLEKAVDTTELYRLDDAVLHPESERETDIPESLLVELLPYTQDTETGIMTFDALTDGIYLLVSLPETEELPGTCVFSRQKGIAWEDPAVTQEEKEEETVTDETADMGEEGTKEQTDIPSEATQEEIVPAEVPAEEPAQTLQSTPKHFTARLSESGQAITVENTTEELQTPAASPRRLLQGIRSSTKLQESEILVTVNAEENVLPDGTTMQVVECSEDETVNEQLSAYYGDGENLCAVDITFFNADGEEIEPNGAVEVTIRTESGEELNGLSVAHIKDDGNVEEMEFLHDVETEALQVRFSAERFSVYAIISPADNGPVEEHIPDLQTLQQYLSEPIALSVIRDDNKTYFFQNTISGTNCLNITTDPDAASEFFFEPVTDGTDGKYYIYTNTSAGKRYIKNTSGNLLGLVASDGTVLELSETGDGRFFMKTQGANKWLQYSGGGKGIRFYPDKNNVYNPKIILSLAETIRTVDDPFNLDGKSFGIGFHDGHATSSAMTADGVTDSNDIRRMDGQTMTMRPDILASSGIMMLSSDIDVDEWMFQNIDGNNYYITTMIDGTEYYLTINKSSVYLSETPHPSYSVIQITKGLGSMSDKFKISSSSYSLTYYPAINHFGSSISNSQYTGMNLLQKSDLNNDDFTQYTAHKVSISDTTEVYNGRQVILYTRVWNPDETKYEYYVVNHDGSLYRCYESGDTISWIGSKVNMALWDFKEYYYEGTTDPNYYYDLQNSYSHKYIAPQLGSGQILSDSPIGLNMNGRRFGNDYSPILTWDNAAYAYAGMKVQDGQLVPSSMGQAGDFYFAIVDETDPESGELTTVNTVNNNEFGIKMRMIDFNNSIVNGRDSGQSAFFGTDKNVQGLMSTNLDETTGYPTATDLTSSEGVSLGTLFNNMQDVNHLFIDSTYRESGYFSYDCTQNFAQLDTGSGDFTVYNQIGTLNGEVARGNTRRHGQFLPYNDIEPSNYATFDGTEIVKNTTNVLAEILPDSDPRKGEKLYNVGDQKGTGRVVDYFFGMEMEASFTQTESGKDAWGHDIIFEFSGDDDFWLYVDNELVLDLGGVHPAETGSINFRTGEVVTRLTSDKNVVVVTTTSLYDVFRSNYEARGMSNAEIEAKLAEIFTTNDNGQKVFKDYSAHTMKMFYMERGAGASNLKMRFNLTAVKPGQVILEKEISGTDKTDYALAEFPYQIYYKVEGDSDYHRLDQSAEHVYVTYKDTDTPVKYRPTFTPAGGSVTYQDVFFLQPGQSAAINVPDDTISYYVVECGVNTDIYDEVNINNATATGVPNGDREDFPIEPDTVENRPKVVYDNHVSENAMRTLTVTKRLFAADGVTPLSAQDDPTTFSYRIYLGGENEAEPSIAFMQPYHVRNENMEYCRWDMATQKFVSLGTGKTVYDNLTDAEKEQATFTMSMNGSVSRIPADYTVEMRDLVVGTKFKVEERAYEIPRGYGLMGYERDAGSYIIEDGDTENSGTIRDNSDPHVFVKNKRGWGLTVNKVWSDESFMVSHDNLYFAVYDAYGVMVPNTLRQMKTDTANGTTQPETSLYYYFDHLVEGSDFGDYEIREVKVTNPTVGNDGYVTAYDSVSPIADGTSFMLGGIPKHASYQTLSYKAAYDQGQISGDFNNLRTATVTNTRPGVMIVKVDENGDPLEHAEFTFDEKGIQNPDSFTSDEEGLVTIAYMQPNVDYTLTETLSPAGYYAGAEEYTVRIDGNGSVSVTGEAGEYQVTQASGDDMAMVEIVNHPFDFIVQKVDDQNVPLANAHFALYNQIEGSDGPMKDYYPIPGFEDMVSTSNGLIKELDETLPAGTYYLVETEAPEGFRKLSSAICFTMSNDGQVILNSGLLPTQLVSGTTAGIRNYTLTVPNSQEPIASVKTLTVRKQVSGNYGERNKNFRFSLQLPGGDQTFMITKNNVTSEASTTNGYYYYTLSHDETIVFYLPQNTTYVVEEIDADQQGYTTVVSGAPTGTLSTDRSVYVTNTRSAPVPGTGLNYIARHLLVGLCMVLACLGVMNLRRQVKKKTKENDPEEE